MVMIITMNSNQNDYNNHDNYKIRKYSDRKINVFTMTVIVLTLL